MRAGELGASHSVPPPNSRGIPRDVPDKFCSGPVKVRACPPGPREATSEMAMMLASKSVGNGAGKHWVLKQNARTPGQLLT